MYFKNFSRKIIIFGRKNIMAKKIRMNNPEDTFMKRQFTYLGEIAHEFFNLPGEYIGSECNEYPNVDGGIPRVDIVYSVKMENGDKFMINIEDETSNVNENTLKKSYNYKNNIYYKTKNPVISVITTTVPVEKCLNGLWISLTDLFTHFIISLPDDNAWKRLNIMLDKARKEGIAIGEKKGIDKGTLRVLNQLVNDFTNNYSVEQLAEKFGYSVEEILNATD